MAESFAQLDKYKESIPFYISAIKLKKNRIDLAYVLADIFETKVKDYKRALSWYEKISGVFPSEIISKEKTEVQNKISFLTNKIEEQKNSGKAQQANKAVDKRTPAAAASTGTSNPEDEAQLSSGTDSENAEVNGSKAPTAQEQEQGGQ